MKVAVAILATLAVSVAGCMSSPTAASAQSHVIIASLAPSAGPVGAQITIAGSGFTATKNTVTFAAVALEPGGEWPNEPSVIPNPASNGDVIGFSILAVWRPACSYAPPGPCPIANVRTAPGTYHVSVTNANGTSNTLTLTVTR